MSESWTQFISPPINQFRFITPLKNLILNLISYVISYMPTVVKSSRYIFLAVNINIVIAEPFLGVSDIDILLIVIKPNLFLYFYDTNSLPGVSHKDH